MSFKYSIKQPDLHHKNKKCLRPTAIVLSFQKEVSLNDLSSGGNFYGEQVKLEYEECKKFHRDQNFSQEAGRVVDTGITFVKNTVPFEKRVVVTTINEKVIMPAENKYWCQAPPE